MWFCHWFNGVQTLCVRNKMVEKLNKLSYLLNCQLPRHVSSVRLILLLPPVSRLLHQSNALSTNPHSFFPLNMTSVMNNSQEKYFTFFGLRRQMLQNLRSSMIVVKNYMTFLLKYLKYIHVSFSKLAVLHFSVFIGCWSLIDTWV